MSALASRPNLEAKGRSAPPGRLRAPPDPAAPSAARRQLPSCDTAREPVGRAACGSRGNLRVVEVRGRATMQGTDRSGQDCHGLLSSCRGTREWEVMAIRGGGGVRIERTGGGHATWQGSTPAEQQISRAVLGSSHGQTVVNAWGVRGVRLISSATGAGGSIKLS